MLDEIKQDAFILIEERQMRQSTAARAMKVSQSLVTRWLQGKSRVQVDRVMLSRKLWPVFRERLIAAPADGAEARADG